MPIVYVSHAIAEVARLATTVVVLSEGRVAAVGPIADMLPLAGASEAARARRPGSRHDLAFGLTALRARRRASCGCRVSICRWEPRCGCASGRAT